MERRGVPVGAQQASHRILDNREHDICRRIADQISATLRLNFERVNIGSLEAIRAAFDEIVVAEHLQAHHGLSVSLREVFKHLHQLSQQTYENKALTFGCLVDRAESRNAESSDSDLKFPADFLNKKKYRALSDGYRTAYHVSGDGQLIDFIALDSFKAPELTGKHFYPAWSEPMARVSRDRRCGISLSRQGDILVFDEGTLRFTYRYGRWQYWNHAQLRTLLRDRARAQHVKPSFLGKLIGEVYRAALDVSFRRSGALFIVLRNRKNLDMIVREGDAINDLTREDVDAAFDETIDIRGIDRAVLVELSSLDGAVVLDNSATLLAYGAVLEPKKKGQLRGSEGSRTKAAIGASFCGLAVKVSSDGDITVYHEGKEFIRI